MRASARFVAYSDESAFNWGRIRGVGAISMHLASAGQLEAEVVEILTASGVREFKWEQTRTARLAFVAQKLVNWVIERALAGQLRIDVLSWDTGDAASSRLGAPTLTRFSAMYQRLLATVTQGWPDDGRWLIHPDEQSAFQWDRLARQLPQAVAIAPRRSHERPLIQVADLFTGLGVFSRECYDPYERWRSFPDAERNVICGRFAEPERFAASIRYRCALLDTFSAACVRQSLSVRLRSHRGLRTLDRSGPINFHWADA